MTLLRLMLTTLVLLAQAWPLQAKAVLHHDAAACETGCCSWLEEAGMAMCACADEAAPATPANIPPAGSREIVPQVTWMAVVDAPLPKRPAKNVDAATRQGDVDEANAQPHVRLAVLFCSFLN
ncbi:MAG: hypothetical protein ACO1TE_29785 [Prosthecobacter sp.]